MEDRFTVHKVDPCGDSLSGILHVRRLTSFLAFVFPSKGQEERERARTAKVTPIPENGDHILFTRHANVT